MDVNHELQSAHTQEYVVFEDGTCCYSATLEQELVDGGTKVSIQWEAGTDRRAAAREAIFLGLSIGIVTGAWSEGFVQELMRQITNCIYDVPSGKQGVEFLFQ
jgi:hypothetical protein